MELTLSTLVITFAHLLRACRYWLTFSSLSLSIRLCVLIFFATTALSFFIPVLMSELLRFLLLVFVSGKFIRVSVTTFVNRLFDLILLGPLLIFFAAPEDFHIKILGVAVTIGTLFFLFLFLIPTPLLDLLEEICLTRLPGKSAFYCLDIINRIRIELRQFIQNRSRIFSLSFLLTVIIWMADFLSFSLLFPRVETSFAAVSVWINYSFIRVLSFVSIECSACNYDAFLLSIRSSFDWHQILASVVIVIFVSLTFIPTLLRWKKARGGF